MISAFGVEHGDTVSKAGVAVPASAGQNMARGAKRVFTAVAGKQGKHAATSNSANRLMLVARGRS